jgi:AcrR family transcriptional regulator
MELMQEDDPRRASVDRISERSGVSKATIYKWWPNRTAAAIDRNLRAGRGAGLAACGWPLWISQGRPPTYTGRV